MSAYAELAVTTNFSFLRGASHPEELAAQAKALGLAGIGIADRNSVAGVVRAHEAAKEQGIRLAAGARLVFADGTPDILSFPQNRAGWANLTRLLTCGKRRAEKGACTLVFDDLLAHAAGLNLIVLAAAPSANRSVGAADGFSSPPPLRGRSAGVAKLAQPAQAWLHARREGGDLYPSQRRKGTPTPDPSPQGGGEELSLPSQEPAPGRTQARPGWRREQAEHEDGEAENSVGAKAILTRLRAAAPDAVWLGASMLYRGDDARRLARLADLAAETKVPLIAVGDVLYHAPERRALQDVVTCIREHVTLDNAGRRLEANAERHLKPAHEMARLFRAAPQAVSETLRFLECCRFSLDELAYDYPDEIREGFATPQEALVAFAEDGARRRYPNGVPAKVRHALDHEYALIGELNYAPYFLTVHDIVRFARGRGILCQGRGSAANSAVCYCLGVTEVDPQRSDLLFERFVSAERREPPDIDVDFEHERREDVIQYIYQRYGRERAGLAATVICYRGRSAIREVGKVFGLSEDAIGALAGTLWGWGKEAVSDEHARRAGFDAADPRLAKMLALTRELIGFPRHLSQHVGGFVITRGRLDDLVPIENAAMEDRTVIEWDKDDLDTLHILKIDVLALGMLTCLRRSLDFLQKHYLHAFTSPRGRGEVDGRAETSPSGEGASTQFETPPHPARTFGPRHPLPASGAREELTPTPGPSPPGGGEVYSLLPQGEREREEPGGEQSPGNSKAPLDLSVIPPEDPAVYRMLSRADSIGVFQVESRAQMTMLPRLKPAQFYDLVIEVAIVRPGPIQGDMVHPYLRRRQGLEKVCFPSPSPEHGPADELRQVLGKTLGVPLFQEQAMRIAIVAAGFTPSEADRLRRAMATFRRVGTIKYFRGKLIDGMAARGYPRDFAERCFNQIEGFGEYGFPESHAASFALLVYASAWIKCRYPDVFAAALLNSQPMGFYAPAQIVRDAREHGVEVRPVDVNFSDWDNTLEKGSPEPFLPRETGEGDRPQGGGGGSRRVSNSPPPPCTQPSLRRLASDAWSSSPATRRRINGALRQQAQTPRLHPRHDDMKGDIRTTHAVRLGLRQISGFSEADARAIEAARGAGFDSIRDLWLRSKRSTAALERLAQADAFRSLGLDRRKALWAVRALRRAGDKDDLPLFARVAMPECEPDVALPPMRLGEHVIADYRHLHLSLKAHPAAFLRAHFDGRNMLRSERLAAIPSGRRVNVAGIVLVRQRPGTAKGVIFMTIEDETGVANIIVWPQVFEIFRPVVLGARLVGVSGRLQNESGVIHVVADRLDDLTPLLTQLASDAGCIDALVRCDEVKRPIPESRIPQRAGSSLAALLKDEPQLTEEFAPAVKVRAIVPKARDFR